MPSGFYLLLRRQRHSWTNLNPWPCGPWWELQVRISKADKNALCVGSLLVSRRSGNNPLDGRIVGKPSKWSVKLPRNRLRGHVPHKDLVNNVMDQNPTSGQLPEATSTGSALYVQLR